MGMAGNLTLLPYTHRQNSTLLSTLKIVIKKVEGLEMLLVGGNLSIQGSTCMGRTLQ